METDVAFKEAASAQGEQNAAAERLRFWRRSLGKHKWGAIGLALVVVLVTTLVVYSMTPVYRSTVTLLIEVGKNKVVSIEEVYSGMGANREYFQTQVEIIKSRELVKKLVQKLNLAQHPALDPRQQKPGFELDWLPADWLPGGWLPATWLPDGWLPEKPALSEQALNDAVIRTVSANLQVQPVRGSQLVKISFDSPDKALTATIANTLADVYIENDLESRLQMTQKASSWLTERLGGLRKKLEASEVALQQFRERERIVSIKGSALSGTEKQLEETSTRLVSIRQQRAEAENAYNQLQAALKAKTSLESIPAVMKNTVVQAARNAEVEAERKLAELSKRYGKEHARMIAAESELKSAHENTRKQVDIVVAGITKEYEVVRANEQSVERVVAQGKAEIQNLNRKEFQLGVLEREVTANRQLYDMFLNRFRETNAAGDLQSTVARVVDPAMVQGGPVSPNKGRAIAIALLAGSILGIMLAFLLEYLDNTVKNSDDVEIKLGLSLLGILERVKTTRKGQELWRMFLQEKTSSFSEAVRTMRTGVMMSALDNPHKVLLVTSSIPEEGKTTVALNLAYAFGQIRKTCLIDADMRRPSLAKVLGLDAAAPGLSHLVAGTAEAASCIYHDKDSGIHIIPAGVVPPNPQELLSSKRFAEVLKKLHETFEIIVIDSPPVQLVSDAIVLSAHANAVIYVVKADSTPYQISRGGIERLQKVGAPILGVVLNQLDIARADKYYGYGKYSVYRKGYNKYGYGYGRGYGYGYGYGSGDKK